MTGLRCDVLIVGGGVAGRSAGIFTARHGLDTCIVDAGDSILQRNAHLENYPGFPLGVNARLLLSMMREQAEHAGCRFIRSEITEVAHGDVGFSATTADDRSIAADWVIAATKNDPEYLYGFDDIEFVDRGKVYVETDRRGRTGVDGLYVAGRLSLQPHQTIVNAGHGATVGITLLEDADVPFYHDWVAPTGYFTDRDRAVPPGCEEIDDEERREREQESIDRMRSHFDELFPDQPVPHPSQRK